MDQAWAHNLPGFFKDNVKPSIANDAFLIPRDNIAIPNIVTLSTLGAVCNRGFIDQARTRISTVRNAILNPSSYIRRLHPHDVTSGTGGIDNLSNLSRFGQPLPFADGEDYPDFQYWSRYTGDEGADPLTVGYAAKVIGEGGMSLSASMKADREQEQYRQQIKAETYRQDQLRAEGGGEMTRSEQFRAAQENARRAALNPAPPAANIGDVTGPVAPPVEQRPLPPTAIAPAPAQNLFADVGTLGDRPTGMNLRRAGYTIQDFSRFFGDVDAGAYIAFIARGDPVFVSVREDLAPDQVNTAVFVPQAVDRAIENAIFGPVEEGAAEGGLPAGDEGEGGAEGAAALEGAGGGGGPEGGTPATGVAANAQAPGQPGGAQAAAALADITRGDVRQAMRQTLENAATTIAQDNAAAPSWRRTLLAELRDQRDIASFMGSHTSNLAAAFSNAYVATPLAKRPRTMGIEGDFSAVRGSKPPGTFGALYEPRVEQTTYAGGDIFSAAEKASDPRYALLHGRKPSSATYLNPDLAYTSGTFRQLESQARSNRYDGNIESPAEQNSLAIQNPTAARNMAQRVAREFAPVPPESRQTAGVLNRNQRVPVSNVTIANRGSITGDPATAFRAGRPTPRR